MGSKCSCLSSTTTEEKVLTTEHKIVRFQHPFKDHHLEFEFSSIFSNSPEDFSESLDIFEVILIQSLLRGYLDRIKLRKNIKIQKSPFIRKENKSLPLNLNRTQSTDLPLRSRILEEIPESEIPDYLTEAVKICLRELAPIGVKNGKSKELVSKGAVFMENKAVYTGQWNKLCQRHGFGIQVWIDGSYYEGQWLYDSCNGQGRLIKSNGDLYEGSFQDDQFHGPGKLLQRSGDLYEGSFEFHQRSGKGFQLQKNISIYTGTFKSDKKHGFGQIRFENGDSYEGEFEYDYIEGFGKYKWKDGREYEGEFKLGMMDGIGEFWWKDGRKYVGQFVKGQKHGQGKFIWPDGRVYDGGWEDDKQSGEGVYATSMGVRQGVWCKGKRVHE